MDSVNILHDGCSGEDRGKKYSKLATTEQFYGAGTSKKVVPLRWCKATTAHAFTIGSPTVISIHEKREFFMVFRGNIVAGITGSIFSDQGMLFGTFLMKNIFIKFPTPILNHIFAQFR